MGSFVWKIYHPFLHRIGIVLKIIDCTKEAIITTLTLYQPTYL